MTDRESQTAPAARTRPRATRPLLRPFPLTVMTLATFLVVFALLMARLTASTHLPLGSLVGAGTPVALNGESTGRGLTTRASGAAASSTPVANPGVAEGASAGTRTLVTRTSGATGTGARDD